MFFSKAVAVWTGASDLERLEIAGRYLHQACFKDLPSAEDISPSPLSDPMYVVHACVHGCAEGCCKS